MKNSKVMNKNKKAEIDKKTGKTQNRNLSTFIIKGVPCNEEYLETPSCITISKFWTTAHLCCYYRNFKTRKYWDKSMDVQLLCVQASITPLYKISLSIVWNYKNKIHDLALSDYGWENFQIITRQFGEEYKGEFITIWGLIYRNHQADNRLNSFDIFVEYR